MKQFKFLSVLAFSLILTSCNGQVKTKKATKDETITKIEVIDFHSTHRCITCNAIEANTKYTLVTYFAKEVKEGKITFQVINVDKKENKKIANHLKFQGLLFF